MSAPRFKEGQRSELTSHRQRISLLQRWLLAVAVLATVACVASAIGFFSARSALRQVNDERARNTLRSCQEVNARHDATVDTINRLTLERLTGRPVPRSVPPAEVKARLAAAIRRADVRTRAQLQQSADSTALVVRSLAPKRDCAALVKRQVGAE